MGMRINIETDLALETMTVERRDELTRAGGVVAEAFGYTRKYMVHLLSKGMPGSPWTGELEAPDMSSPASLTP